MSWSFIAIVISIVCFVLVLLHVHAGIDLTVLGLLFLAIGHLPLGEIALPQRKSAE